MATASAFGFSGFDPLGSLWEQGFNNNQMDKQYDQDMSAWQAQQAYNSPQQQMTRLKAAGLNPNLVYGSGNVTNTTDSYPVKQVAGIKYPSEQGMASKLTEFQDVRAKDLQNQNMQFQNEILNKQKQLLNDKHLENLGLDTEFKAQGNPMKLQGMATENSKKLNELSFMDRTFDDRTATMTAKLKGLMLGNLLQEGINPERIKGEHIRNMNENLKAARNRVGLLYDTSAFSEKLKKIAIENTLNEERTDLLKLQKHYDTSTLIGREKFTNNANKNKTIDQSFRLMDILTNIMRGIK